MRFAEVTGQEHVKAQLVKSVHENRISHAQLFIGAEGTGGLPLALAYAQFILCENRNETDSCGVCNSCKKIQKLVHPDLHLSFPVIRNAKTPTGEGPLSAEMINEFRSYILEHPYSNAYDWLQSVNAENKQGNISAKECREISRKLNLRVYEGEYKILVMWMADYLGKEGNTLLKMIEEPPDKTLILLVVEDLEKILNTILSRTQIVKIPRIADKAIIEALELREVPTEEARAIARLSEGNFYAAQKLVEQQASEHQENFLKWYRLCLTNDREGIVEWVNKMAGIGREQQKNFFKYCLHFYREAMMKANIETYEPRLAPSQVQAAEFTAQNLSLDQYGTIITKIEEAHYHIERNAHPKILMLDLTINITMVLANKHKAAAKA